MSCSQIRRRAPVRHDWRVGDSVVARPSRLINTCVSIIIRVHAQNGAHISRAQMYPFNSWFGYLLRTYSMMVITSHYPGHYRWTVARLSLGPAWRRAHATYGTVCTLGDNEEPYRIPLCRGVYDVVYCQPYLPAPLVR